MGELLYKDRWADPNQERLGGTIENIYWSREGALTWELFVITAIGTYSFTPGSAPLF